MKKIISILLACLCVTSAIAQPVINRTTGTSTVNDPRLMASTNLLVPRYADTSAAISGANLGIDTCGAIIFTYDVSCLWLRACSPKRWVRILKLGDAGNVDTFSISTRLWRQKGDDSLGAIKMGYSDTASALSNYTRGVGGAGRLTFWTATRTISSDADATYDATTNTASMDSMVLRRVHTDQLLLRPNTNLIVAPDSAHAGGDSYTAGTGATTYDSSYIPYWSRFMGFTVSNYAVGGKGVWWMAKEHILRLSPGHRAMAFQFAGFNDQRRNSFTRTTLNKIIDCYKSVFINQYAATSVAAGNGANVTRHGTFNTTYDPSSVGGKSIATGASTTNAGDSIRFTCTDCTTAYVTWIGADNSGAGFNYTDSADIYVDGAFEARISQNRRWDGVSDGAYDNRRGPGGWFKTGMTSGTHVLTVINRHAGNFCTFDRFGTLVSSQNALPLYMFHAAYNNLAGFAVSPSNGSVRAVDSVNAKLDSLYATLPTSIYPVFMVPSDQILDTLTDYNVDNIHPNNQGHRKLYEGALAIYNPLEGTQDGLLETDGLDLYWNSGGIRHTVLMESPVPDTPAIYASPSAQQTAFINITSSSMSTIGGRLTIGNTGLGTATPALRLIIRDNFIWDPYEFAGRLYQWSRNNAGTNGVPVTYGGSTINFSTLAASTETVQATINTTGLGVGTTSPDNKLHSELSGAATTTVGHPLRITHITSGTAAAGFGVGEEFEAENASGTNRVIASITVPYVTATNALEDADVIYSTMAGGSFAERFRMRFNGLFTIGGITSSRPALGANGVNLRARLADNSADTDLEVLGEAYGINWNGSNEVTTKNDVYDKIEGSRLRNTATLDFPSTAAQTSSDLTITVTGAADGDAVAIGVPNGSTLSNGCFTAWVSATDTVTIRFTNNSSGPLDPLSGTFRAIVLKL